MAHAYFVTGEAEEGISAASAFAEAALGVPTVGNPDVMIFRHGLFSVDDARALRARADLAPVSSDQKILIVSVGRLFHEAQNALLKLFEEPPAGTILVLVLPSEGILLPTLRSRLSTLPNVTTSDGASTEASAFIKASKAEREKMIAKVLDRAKSDKDDEKQAARLTAIHIAEELARAAHARWQSELTPAKRKELQDFLSDLNRFTPILHERSAPLKMIFEHLQLVIPANV